MKKCNDNIITVREHEQKRGEQMKKVEMDYSKLKGKIKEVLGTQNRLAKELDVDETTMSNKLNNNTYFTQVEIINICNILHIEYINIPIYFFEQKVREIEQK